MNRLPAEWEPQECVELAWPRDPLTFPDRLDKVRAVYAAIVEGICKTQNVRLLCHPELEPGLQELFAGQERLVIVPVEHQDGWVRDYGLLTVASKEGPKHLKFQFRAWGGKYETLLKDNDVAPQVASDGHYHNPIEEIDFELEGGAVETDGQGTFLATRSVVAARGQTEAEFEAILTEHLGAKKIIWLDNGIVGDDTDGHIDTIARFARPRVVLAARAPHSSPDFEVLERNWRVLHGSTDARGRPLELHALPVPEPVFTKEKEPLPAGYANFLILNEVVLVPTFGCVQDRMAMHIIEQEVGRQAVGIPHQDLIWGFGGIHCLSMQFPLSPALEP